MTDQIAPADPLAAAGIDRNDPGYLRHCIRTDCSASYNALDVEKGSESAEGWRRLVSAASGVICPGHAGPLIDGSHMPAWITQDDLDLPVVAGIRCACGWEWRPGKPHATQGEHQDQWVAHLIAATAPADLLAAELEAIGQRHRTVHGICIWCSHPSPCDCAGLLKVVTEMVKPHQPGLFTVEASLLCGKHYNHPYFSITALEAADLNACKECKAEAWLSCAGCGRSVRFERCRVRSDIAKALLEVPDGN